jgi:Arm DNA-binding domain
MQSPPRKRLYLEVSPPGGKLWRYKYRFGGKEKRIGFGRYPDVGLKEARELRDEARKSLAVRIDPSKFPKASGAELFSLGYPNRLMHQDVQLFFCPESGGR